MLTRSHKAILKLNQTENLTVISLEKSTHAVIETNFGQECHRTCQLLFNFCIISVDYQV